MIDFAYIKHHGWSEDGNIMSTKDTFSQDMKTILIGGHNSDESDDTDDSDGELESDVDSVDDEEDDDA